MKDKIKFTEENVFGSKPGFPFEPIPRRLVENEIKGTHITSAHLDIEIGEEFAAAIRKFLDGDTSPSVVFEVKNDGVEISVRLIRRLDGD